MGHEPQRELHVRKEYEFHRDLDLSPGETSALQFIHERHPDVRVDLMHVRDEADVGWIIARVRVPVRGSSGRAVIHDYFLSATGRVFRGEPSFLNSHFTRRSNVELRPADYEERSRERLARHRS